MWQDYYIVKTIDEAIEIIHERRERGRIVAGGTDLMLEMDRGKRNNVDTLIDISRIAQKDHIVMDDKGNIHIGPLVTHNQCFASEMIQTNAYPLAQAAAQVGSPQIRNRGTIAGNLITASPANDTIPPLLALGAKVTLKSHQGERVVSLEDFYLGVRETVIRPDEILVDIFFPGLIVKQGMKQIGIFEKNGLRKAQAISVINTCIILTMEEQWISNAKIVLGSVAAKVVRAKQAEHFLVGKSLTSNVIEETSRLAILSAKPIEDIRGGIAYRLEILRVAIHRGLSSLANNAEREKSSFTSLPLLGGKIGSDSFRSVLSEHFSLSKSLSSQKPIITQINGKTYQFNQGHHRSLLHLLRDEAGLIGSKEGCSEGECGACTVFLDGAAVMACLVPAPRAHGAEIVTIEGIAQDGNLHDVQKAFIDRGAVQCGYCTPGFIMSAVKLIEEQREPSREEIQNAISGNLCRCTGYYKIVEAIEYAVKNRKITEN